MPLINKTGIVILSGGKSSRLGQPKQLLQIKGIPLIQHIVQTAKNADLGPIVVVTGAHGHMIKPLLGDVCITENPDWEEGMAASIRAGIQYIQHNFPEIDGLFLLVSDQPYLSVPVLRALYQLQQKENYIAVASRYNNQYGTPVLVHKDLWSDLLALKGDVGARKMLTTIEDQIGSIPFEEGKFDLDTMDDYAQFKQHETC